MNTSYALFAPIAYILLACICRLNIMTPQNSSILWRLVYIFLATWAGWIAVDLAETGYASFRDAMGCCAMCLYMHITKIRWEESVPEIAR